MKKTLSVLLTVATMMVALGGCGESEVERLARETRARALQDDARLKAATAKHFDSLNNNAFSDAKPAQFDAAPGTTLGHPKPEKTPVDGGVKAP